MTTAIQEAQARAEYLLTDSTSLMGTMAQRFAEEFAANPDDQKAHARAARTEQMYRAACYLRLRRDAILDITTQAEATALRATFDYEDTETLDLIWRGYVHEAFSKLPVA
jgi:hypothetical protein